MKNDNFKDPAKVFNRFQASFHVPNTQRSCREEAFDLKESYNETIGQMDVHLTNVFLMCGYPQDQMDSHKGEILFHAVKYFDIKWYIHETLPSSTRPCWTKVR